MQEQALAAGVIAIIVGAVELFFGRRLFWLFVAIAGFLIGYFLAPAIFSSINSTVRVLVGIGIGVLFGLLAMVFTRFMVALAGFFVFGPAAVLLIRYFGASAPNGSTWYWVAYVIGGLIGFVLLWAFFDWALVVLTSLAGAGGIVRGITSLTSSLSGTWQIVVFVVVAILGILFQARSLTGTRVFGGPRKL
jgi:hypothetical protein